MNDEFLTRFREEPRAEFAETLYERISRETQPRVTWALAKKLTFRNAVVVFAFLFFIAACVYAVSEKRWNKVGDIWVDVQKTYKIEFVPPPGEKLVLSQTQDYECLTVEEAREILRFDFQIPTWIPEGFTFDGRMCGVERTSDFAGLSWIGPDKYSRINITLHNLRWNDGVKDRIGPPYTMFPVAPGSYKEVQVHGRPAILVRGDWEEPWRTEEPVGGKIELKWNKKRGLQLYWVDGEVLYYLHTLADVSAEDLIKMAESAR